MKKKPQLLLGSEFDYFGERQKTSPTQSVTKEQEKKCYDLHNL